MILLMGSCASYDKFREVTEEYKIPQKDYPADFNQTWLAVIQVMKRFGNCFNFHQHA